MRSRFKRLRMSFFGKPVPTFPGHALTAAFPLCERVLPQHCSAKTEVGNRRLLCGAPRRMAQASNVRHCFEAAAFAGAAALRWPCNERLARYRFQPSPALALMVGVSVN